MGALRALGALQREHVHCDVGGLPDLCSQTNELPGPLVHAHAHTHTLRAALKPLFQRLQKAGSHSSFLSAVQSHVRAAASLLEGTPPAVGRLRGAAPERAVWCARRAHQGTQVLPG